MKKLIVALALAWLLPGVAQATDQPATGPAPGWVKPADLPAASAPDDGAPVRILLSDQQIALEPGKQTLYSHVALLIQTPNGLAAGNLSLPWRPETDALTVHKLLIRRGGQTIDVLASGQTFTVMRRETNLESATLDGVLTANIQPEGLQVGDVIELAASIVTRDPTLKHHVEQIAGAWNGVPVTRAHLRVHWPSAMPIRIRQSPGLPALKPVRAGGTTAIELAADDVQPLFGPKGAPGRYQLGRMVELTSFASWAEVGALLAPLYEAAAVLPAQGPLRAELERIRAASADSRTRAEAALALVQDRIRYVALAMGAGALVPADAETTWSRRYGDCKAKTALLLALLRALGIEAEAVAVNAGGGDGMDARLPMIGQFNHVLVRATIGGRHYWLDGTRTGDTSLSRLTVPPFGWGLPLAASGAALVRIEPEPLAEPSSLLDIRIDARAGLTVPAPFKAERVLRGDDAIAGNLAVGALVGDARERALREYWRSQFDFIDIRTVGMSFDAKAGEQRFTVEGLARMDWSGDRYETDHTSVGYQADFTREPGPDRDAPYAVGHPFHSRTVETILLPPGFERASAGAGGDVDETIAGVAYRRRVVFDGGKVTIEKSERSVASEFPAKDAPAAQARLRELADRTVYIRKPAGYVPTEEEVKHSLSSEPATASGFIDRGNLLLNRGRYDEAIADFSRANALDPQDPWALANRGIARAWKGDLDAAAKDLDAAHALDSRNPVVFRARGLVAQRKGDAAAAVAAYSTALEIEPDSGFALGHRAEAHRAAGNDEAALRDAAAALAKNPRWIDLYLLRANILRRQGKREAAIAEAEAVAKANPENSYAQVVAGNIHGAFGQDAEAMRAFDRALAIKPDAFVYLNRSARRPKADVAGRRSDIEAALALAPGDIDALDAKAELQSDIGDLAGAIATYGKAIALFPQRADLRVGRGIAYARKGDKARAESDFAAARSAAAAKPGQLNNLCWAKATAGVALESALAECNAALEGAPGTAAILDSRALVLLRLGRLDEAIADYSAALAKAADMSSSLYGRALAWARKGDKARADADAAAALKVEPGVRARFEGYGLTL